MFVMVDIPGSKAIFFEQCVTAQKRCISGHTEALSKKRLINSNEAKQPSGGGGLPRLSSLAIMKTRLSSTCQEIVGRFAGFHADSSRADALVFMSPIPTGCSKLQPGMVVFLAAVHCCGFCTEPLGKEEHGCLYLTCCLASGVCCTRL